MASSGRRMATDGSGTQHEEDKGFAENSALKEEHDRFSRRRGQPIPRAGDRSSWAVRL